MSMLKQFRMQKAWGQEDMAKKLDISINAYRNYELGKRMLPCDVLMRFLKMRANKKDIELANILEEVCAMKK